MMNKVICIAIFLALFTGFSQDAFAGGDKYTPPKKHGPPNNRPPDNRPPHKDCKKNCGNDGGDISIDIDQDSSLTVVDKSEINIGGDEIEIENEVTVKGDTIKINNEIEGDTIVAEGGAGGDGGNAVIESGAINNKNVNESISEANSESNSESSSASTSEANASVGDVNVYNVREAEKRIAGTMYVGTPDSPTAILYNAQADAAEKGAAIRQEYIEVCNEKHTRRNPIQTKHWKRNDVRVQFTNHQNFTKRQKLGLDVPVTLVQPHDDGGIVKATCLGMALVDSVEKKESLSMGEVESRFYQFVTDTLGQCTSEIYLYSMEEGLARNRGVDTNSGAWNALSSLTNIIDDGTGGIGGGTSFGRSGAFGRVQLGNTYWVLCDDPHGIPFDFGIKTEDPPEVESKATVHVTEDVAIPPVEEVIQKPQRDLKKRQLNQIKPAFAKPKE